MSKERRSGMYHLSAYYLSKTVSELPLVVIQLQPTFFLIITYWIVGLHGVASFFSTPLVIITNSIVAQVTITILYMQLLLILLYYKIWILDFYKS